MFIRESLLLLALLTAPAFSAQLTAQTDYGIIDLYPEGIPCANEEEEKMDYRERIGWSVTSVHHPVLHHYAPLPAMDAKSAIIIAPGGGYTMQAWEWEGIKFAQLLAAEGIHAFVLRYRLPIQETRLKCKSSVAMMDAHRAVSTVRAMADSMGLRSDKVAFMGFSAGGHLAGSTAIHFPDANQRAAGFAQTFSARPDASILMYPVTIMDDSGQGHRGSAVNLLGENYLESDLREYYDLPGQVHEDVPPTILFHASDDASVPVENSLRYYRALVANGVPASLHVYENGGHGFSTAKHFDGPVRDWSATLIAWLSGQGFVK